MKKLYMGQKMIVSALAGMILIPGECSQDTGSRK